MRGHGHNGNGNGAAPERGVYIDYLNRWAWTVDSRGRRSAYREIPTPDEAAAVEADLFRELDEHDPIPSSAFVPSPIRHLRLI